MEKERKGKKKSRGFEYDCETHSSRKLIGSTLEVFADYLRLAYVVRNGGNSLNF